MHVVPIQAADANPPNRMTYQGYVVDSTGTALGDASPVIFEVVFRIYAEPQGGVSLWSEKQTVVFNNGSFAVILGEGEVEGSELHPELSSIFVSTTASDRYIGITVKGLGGGDVEIAPRLRLLSAPYSFLSSRASSLVNDTGAVLINSNNGNLLIGGPIQSTGGDPRGANSVDLQVVRTGSSSVSQGEVSVIGGGKNNRAQLRAATVSGGESNAANGENSTVSGGTLNTASGTNSSVGGGHNNTANANSSTVTGGQTNQAIAQHATVGGGSENTASGNYSSVAGGQLNTATAAYASNVGGRNNKATGTHSSTLGGESNLAQGTYSGARQRF